MAEYVTTKAVAARLQVSPETVRAYAREGLIPARTTPKGHRRYDLDEVLDAVGASSAELERVADGDTVSVGRTTDRARLAAGPRVNFELEDGELALEIRALAGDGRRGATLRVGGDPGDHSANRVHAALMSWAEPVRLATRARER